MKSNKLKKSRELMKKKQQAVCVGVEQKLIKFNCSYDNLKCFINDNHPKTDRKRAPSKYNFNLTGGKNSPLQEMQAVQIHHKLIRSCSPDPSQQASNQILQQIQQKGLKCAWKEIQQTKTQFSSQQQWQQKQILHQTFTECSSSYGKHHSGSHGKNHSHASTLDRFEGYYNQGGYTQARMIMTGDKMMMGQSNMGTSIVGEKIGQATMATSSYVTMATSSYVISERNRYYDSNLVFQIQPFNIGNDPRTTLMIKNIPNKYTIQDLSNQIDYYFQNSYDFLYLPCDIKNNCNVGYGFINFVNTEILLQFYKKFHNKKWLKFRSDKICVLTYARLQGLSSLIQHFQNSKVLNHKDKRYQPIIKDIQQCKKIESLIKQQQSQQSTINL